MIELFNRNLEKTEPEYYYIVRQFVTTFGEDEGKNEPFETEDKFVGNDLMKCKTDAEKFYWEKLKGLSKSKYFLEFASPKDFVLGENAAFSINLLLVEYYSDDFSIELDLIGEDDSEENQEIEMAVLKSKGYI